MTPAGLGATRVHVARREPRPPPHLGRRPAACSRPPRSTAPVRALAARRLRAAGARPRPRVHRRRRRRGALPRGRRARRAGRRRRRAPPGFVAPRARPRSSSRRSRSGRGTARGAHGAAPGPRARRAGAARATPALPAVRRRGALRAVHADRRRAARGRRRPAAGRCRRCGDRDRAAAPAVATPGRGPTSSASCVGDGRSRPRGGRRPPRARPRATNVDDLDPRLWPAVLDRLLDGRRRRRVADADPDEEGPPRAHPVGAVRRRHRATRCAGVVFRETSTIGAARARRRQARAGPRSHTVDGRRRPRPGEGRRSSTARWSTRSRSTTTSPRPPPRVRAPVKVVLAEAVAAIHAAGSRRDRTAAGRCSWSTR